MNPTTAADTASSRQVTREEQLARRDAYLHGIDVMYIGGPQGNVTHENLLRSEYNRLRDKSKELYPLPPIIRRRVLIDPRGEVAAGQYLYFTTDAEGRLSYTYATSIEEARSRSFVYPLHDCDYLTISPDRWDCWKDLQTTPFETVQDEG
jgi:hypothetical protein